MSHAHTRPGFLLIDHETDDSKVDVLFQNITLLGRGTNAVIVKFYLRNIETECVMRIPVPLVIENTIPDIQKCLRFHGVPHTLNYSHVIQLHYGLVRRIVNLATNSSKIDPIPLRSDESVLKHIGSLKCFNLTLSEPWHSDMDQFIRNCEIDPSVQSVPSHRLSPRCIFKVAFLVLVALKGIHERGYVHMDLHTKNVLVKLKRRDEQMNALYIEDVCIMDFDFCTRIGTRLSQSRAQDWLGKHWNKCPNGVADPLTDIYAVTRIVLALTSICEQRSSVPPYVANHTNMTNMMSEDMGYREEKNRTAIELLKQFCWLVDEHPHRSVDIADRFRKSASGMISWLAD